MIWWGLGFGVVESMDRSVEGRRRACRVRLVDACVYVEGAAPECVKNYML